MDVRQLAGLGAVTWLAGGGLQWWLVSEPMLTVAVGVLWAVAVPLLVREHHALNREVDNWTDWSGAVWSGAFGALAGASARRSRCRSRVHSGTGRRRWWSSTAS